MFTRNEKLPLGPLILTECLKRLPAESSHPAIFVGLIVRFANFRNDRHFNLG
jgi:hypothetical protein